MTSFAERMVNRESWTGLMMGNHALVRAMLEEGVMVAAAYPGSPTPEIAEAILAVPQERRRMHFEFSTNEKVALETAFGASINGHMSTCFFKSVGLNVALDSCVQLSMLDCNGGLVIILGDDPGANSSQNEQDNRHIARMAYIPMFEPGNPSEAYQMFREAAQLSKRLKQPVFLRMTTHVCHARELIEFGEIPAEDYDWTPKYQAKGLEYWPITAAVFPLKRKALAKLAAAEKHAEESSFTQVLSINGSAAINGKRYGVITAAIPAFAVLEVQEELGLQLDVLKLGITYPLPRQRILDFLSSHDEVFILEELDRVIEPEIKMLAFDNKVQTIIHVRTEVEDLMKEFVPARTHDILNRIWPELVPARELPAAASETVSPRVAQMCPGCGHRSAFFAVRELIRKEYPDAITVADIGCHSLGSMEPYEMGTVLLCMGHSNGTGAGLSIGNDTRPVITFIGDSTFYHAGLPAIINAITYNHNMTLIVMENFTTAMTGHQPTHGSGEYGNKISIPDVLESLGCRFIRSVDAYMQDKLQELIREAIAFDGFSVVIAKHPCMLKFVRERARKLGQQKASAVGAGKENDSSGSEKEVI